MLNTIAHRVVPCVLTTTAATATLQLYKEASTTPCDEIIFLTKLIEKSKHKALSAYKQDQTLQDEAKILQHAACKCATNIKGRQFQALYALATHNLQAARKATLQAQEILAQTGILSSRLAQIRILIHTNPIGSPTLVSTTKSTNLAGYASGINDYCTIKATFPQGKFGLCSEARPGKEGITWAVSNLDKVDKLRLTDDKHLANAERTVKVLVGGTASSASTTGAIPGFCHSGTGIASAGTNPLGTTDLDTPYNTYTITEISIGKTGKAQAACTTDLGDEQYGSKTHTVTAKQTAQAICKLRDIKIPVVTSIGDETAEKLQQSEHMQQIADLILKGEEPKGQTGDKQKESVKNLFGDLKGSVSDKLLKPLATAEIQYTLKGDTKKHKVGTDSNTETVHYAAAACYHNQLKEMQERIEISILQQKKDEDCADKKR
uniref:Variant surface glycoprotein 1125.2571 n=1 Tax=Trypanosoma brucei TaxID=5691 RepID=A0A1J0R8D9_9TRYP|nr:variant surface glycoprotein 1125.2571 [Trypanosoma brucei]